MLRVGRTGSLPFTGGLFLRGTFSLELDAMNRVGAHISIKAAPKYSRLRCSGNQVVLDFLAFQAQLTTALSFLCKELSQGKNKELSIPSLMNVVLILLQGQI